MNTRQQLFIDKHLVKPVAVVVNWMVRLAGKLLRIDHNLDRDFKVIAVCKFKGMGSVIQATPMLSAIRKKYPNAEIIFVSTVANREILSLIDTVDTSILIDDKNAFRLLTSSFRALLRLIGKRPGVYFDLEIYADFSTVFTAFTLSKNRIGFYLRSSSFRMGIYTHMMFFNTQAPISKAYLQMASLLGVDTEGAALYPLGGNSERPKGYTPNYIVINPNASDLRLERRWGAGRFAALIDRLGMAFPDYDIVLIGSKGEADYTTSVAAQTQAIRVVNVAGKTTLSEVIALIKHATLMITNDTGPMHLAFSTSVPVVCLFGPCAPEQYGMSTQAHVLYKKVYCSPCVHEFEAPPCKGNNVCMQMITPDEVFEKAKALIEHPGKGSSGSAPEVIYKVDKNALGLVLR